jgi:hypothetical protein
MEEHTGRGLAHGLKRNDVTGPVGMRNGMGRRVGPSTTPTELPV